MELESKDVVSTPQLENAASTVAFPTQFYSDEAAMHPPKSDTITLEQYKLVPTDKPNVMVFSDVEGVEYDTDEMIKEAQQCIEAFHDSYTAGVCFAVGFTCGKQREYISSIVSPEIADNLPIGKAIAMLSPPGSGKTFLMCQIAMLSGRKIIILTNRRACKIQLLKDILKKIAEAGEPEKNKATEEKEEPVTIKECNNIVHFAVLSGFLSDIISDESLKKLVELGFCKAPASTKYHGNHPGGLFEHSTEVAIQLVELSLKLNLDWERKESPLIVGLFHDLCKVDQYVRQPDGTYKWNTEVDQRHAAKSIDYIEKYTDLKLTDEERACILHHMGAFGDKDAQSAYTEAIKKYPNVLYTHTADMIASQIKNK